ncbi:MULTISPECIES: hypothetical protein [unclassified Tenacibaculum]|uniref:hypothetical protein n=1 Tax=unclassified Tenacibaculum TaxID=2635139 RepID=UPI001F371284|nr:MULTISPECIES: hypothetical protein [unclassified Tenacibaculum]MCF2876542.1 hypothetical protein [Tenacibaculum sp. Cn5-1]MCF2936551.1 hypothetical protein [Tenacibaculum sp. Cn5-34]MCG7511856.1 hypothetical protein [Tenacibaculum sp. Cn5-46]
MKINLKQVKLTFSIILIGFSITISAQSPSQEEFLPINPPIDFEVFASKEILSIQNVFMRPLKKMEKFSVFNMLTYSQFYEDKNVVFVGSTTLNYEVAKNLSISGGIATNSIDGIHPILGINYAYVSKEMLLILAPSIDLIDDKSLEALFLYEYKPRLSKKTSLYTRIQFLYNHNIRQDTHNRSYLNLRLGLSFNNISIGIGSNLDAFGPFKIKKENYGLFAKFLI